MVTSEDSELEDKPLDPAMERVQRKLRRLMLVAGLTLGIGLLAVFAGIIYRIATVDHKGRAPAGGALLQAASIPEGARLVSTTAVGKDLVLTYEHAAGTTLVLIDGGSLAVLGRLDLKPGAPVPESAAPKAP
jgi:hypothetical protein